MYLEITKQCLRYAEHLLHSAHPTLASQLMGESVLSAI